MNTYKEYYTHPLRDKLKIHATFKLLDSNGVKHRGRIGTWTRQGEKIAYVHTDCRDDNLSVEDFKESEVRLQLDPNDPTQCQKCLNSAYIERETPDDVNFTLYAWSKLRSGRSALKVNSKTSASALRKRYNEHSETLSHLKKQLQGRDLPAEYRNFIGDCISELETIIEKLNALSTDDDAKAKLELKVQEFLVPAKYREQRFELDSEPKLIGIHPAPAYGSIRGGNNASTLVDSIINIFGIRNDQSVVLYAPAYFYSYLLGVLHFGKNNILVVSAKPPATEDERKLQAALWSPEAENALACLSKAGKSVEALTSE